MEVTQFCSKKRENCIILSKNRSQNFHFELIIDFWIITYIIDWKNDKKFGSGPGDMKDQSSDDTLDDVFLIFLKKFQKHVLRAKNIKKRMALEKCFAQNLWSFDFENAFWKSILFDFFNFLFCNCLQSQGSPNFFQK